MAQKREEFAELLGARFAERLPSFGGGAFGMARLAHLLHQRLTPSTGRRTGRPTDASWVVRPKVPMSKATQAKLRKLAARVSAGGRRVSAMQIAAHLLEESLQRVETA